MNKDYQLQVTHHEDGDLDDMFSHLPPQDIFEAKKDEIAAQLATLMAHSECTRSELADCLNWSKSRVTNVLSGKSNLTLKTVYEFCAALGHDFDIIFRVPYHHRTSQPWEAARFEMRPIAERLAKNFDIKLDFLVQSASQVSSDISRGNHRDIYFSCNFSNSKIESGVDVFELNHHAASVQFLSPLAPVPFNAVSVCAQSNLEE